MGNGCICFNNICDKEIKVDIYQEDNKHPVQMTNLYSIAKYFNDANVKTEKKNIRKILSFKKLKNLNRHNTMGNSKYELMLKRLLEQKKIERKGPKRRETIRLSNNKFLTKLIKEVIEDKNKKKNNIKEKEKNKSKENNFQKKESILINFKDKNNDLSKHSVIITNKIFHKKITDNLDDTVLNGANIVNEINPTSGNNSKINNDE